MSGDCQWARDLRNARRWRRAGGAIFVGFAAFFVLLGLGLFGLVRMDVVFGAAVLVCFGSMLTILGLSIWAME